MNRQSPTIPRLLFPSAQFAALAAEIDPGILIGYDSQMVDGTQLAGSDYTNWMVQTLQQCAIQGFTPGFIADHYYAQSPGDESDSSLLGVSNTTTSASNPYDWTQRADDYDALFHQYLPDANIQLIADEVNSVSSSPGKQSTSLVNGLFVADALGSALETTGSDSLTGYDGFWLWDLHNGPVTNGNNSSSLYGWRNYGDYGILGNGSGSEQTNELSPDYFAIELGSEIMVPGGTVVASSEDNETSMDVYAVLEANGDLDLLVVNKTNPNSGTPPNNQPDPTLTEQFNLSGFTASGQAEIWEYGVAQDDAQANSSNHAASIDNFNTTLSISGDSFSYAVPDYTMMVISLTPESGPTVAQAAAADPNPVTGTTTALSALGSENGSGAGLNYTWSATSVPAGVNAPIYSVNGTNAAANTTATFYGAGSYSFLVTISDAENNSVTSSVNVTVEQTPTGVIVSPSSATVATGGTQQFSATATDQFNNPISSPTFTWSITGTSDGNSIDGTGLATLGSTPGTFTVMATLGSASNTAQVSADVAPTVSSFQVNDGNAQRSMVDSLTVTFNESVTLADNAITLNLLSQTGGSPTPMSFTLSGSGTTYVLTFTGSDDVGNSLPDGAYELIVSAGGVSGTGNLNMSADQDYEFFRLYGDFNGDGKVDSADFGVLAIDYGTQTNSSDWYLDYNDDGVIDSADFGAFAVRYGSSISIPSDPNLALLAAATTVPATPPTPTSTATSTSATKELLATTTTTPPRLSSTRRNMFDIGTNSETPALEVIDGSDDRRRGGDVGVWPAARVRRTGQSGSNPILG